MSKNDYKLYLFEDGCAILDPIKNKLLCYYNYDSPMVVFLNRLESLWNFWRYEKSIIKCKNPSEVNFYLTQKQKFYE